MTMMMKIMMTPVTTEAKTNLMFRKNTVTYGAYFKWYQKSLPTDFYLIISKTSPKKT